MNDEMLRAPKILRDFLTYIETIKGQSPNTVKEYYYDLRTYFRFLALHTGAVPQSEPFESVDLSVITLNHLAAVTLSDLYEYMAYINGQRHNAASSRARKVSSLKTFYKYLHTKTGAIPSDPTLHLDAPKIGKRLPKYLDLDSSLGLLHAADGENRRDYCMLTLLLNCGLRVSELVSINLSDLTKDRMTVIGKGNKERTVYLNDACQAAISGYLNSRPKDGLKDRNALFLNKNKGRIGVRGVQLIVKKYLQLAGLDSTRYSTHKLRHTAATLMYQHGHVDVLALQQILGHESLSTTQIYTHTNSESLRKAVDSNPLSGAKSKRTDDI